MGTKELKPTVKINEVLGDIGEINAEIKNIIIENKIVNIFPKKVLKELKSIKEKKKTKRKEKTTQSHLPSL